MGTSPRITRCGRRRSRGCPPSVLCSGFRVPTGEHHAAVSEHQRPRAHRRPADGRAGDDRRDGGLVLLPPVRLAERVRIPAGCRQGRLFPHRPGDAQLREPAALPARHRDADHAVPDRGRRRRGHRLHAGRRAPDRHRLVRQLKLVRGTMTFVADVKPRFDYGRAPHTLDITGEGVIFTSGGPDRTHLTLSPTGMREVTLGEHEGYAIERIGDDLRITMTLREGESAGVMLESMGGKPRRISAGELAQMMDDTSKFWRDWVHRSTYRGRWREMVARSAVTLKLMTYAPTGALVAAPTTGLPELTGGERNWDYRYTWIRDASFSVYALLGLGYAEEAAAFGQWTRDRLIEHGGNGNGATPMKIMYRVDGSSDLTEETLDHLEGWRGSRPVRVGNGAADQLQL